MANSEDQQQWCPIQKIIFLKLFRVFVQNKFFFWYFKFVYKWFNQNEAVYTPQVNYF